MLGIDRGDEDWAMKIDQVFSLSFSIFRACQRGTVF